MLEVINVSSRGQIVIPEKMRRLLKIKEGSRLVLIEKEGQLIIKKEGDLLKQLSREDQDESQEWLLLERGKE